MNQPKLKALVFFIGMLLVGYALAIPLFTAVFQMLVGPVLFLNLTACAILFAVVMTILLDRPMELELFKWPEKKPDINPEQFLPPLPSPTVESQPEVAPQPVTPIQSTEPTASQRLFPHDTPTEHWNIDFGDSKQAYQGSDLPVWILAGWAIFIIWSILYLAAGLPTAF